MATAKETMVEIIARQPEDHTFEQILRELAYAGMVQRGLTDADEGRVHADLEIQSRVESWRP